MGQRCGTPEQCMAANTRVGETIENETGARFALLITSIVQIAASLVAIACWSVLLVKDNVGFDDIEVGYGLWVGIYTLIPGILGVLLCLPILAYHNRASLFYTQFGLTMGFGGIVTQLIINGLDVYSAGKNTTEEPALSWDDPALMRDLGLVSFVVAIVLMTTIAPVSACYGVILSRVNRACKAQISEGSC